MKHVSWIKLWHYKQLAPLRQFNVARSARISIFLQVFKISSPWKTTLNYAKLLLQNFLESLELRIWNYITFTKFWIKLIENELGSICKKSFFVQNFNKFSVSIILQICNWTKRILLSERENPLSTTHIKSNPIWRTLIHVSTFKNHHRK